MEDGIYDIIFDEAGLDNAVAASQYLLVFDASGRIDLLGSLQRITNLFQEDGSDLLQELKNTIVFIRDEAFGLILNPDAYDNISNNQLDALNLALANPEAFDAAAQNIQNLIDSSITSPPGGIPPGDTGG